MNKPRLPSPSQRITLVGRTGTGKTVAGLWHLSRQPINKMPYVLIDFKGDDHIALIERSQEIDFSFKPKKPGLYVLRPRLSEKEKVDEYLGKLWERGRIGLFVDEGFMIEGDNFDTILMQGRSLLIPAIICSQRPVWITRYAFSEADFFQVFDLNDDSDKARVSAFMRVNLLREPDLPEHWSWYYDVGRKQAFKFKPVPNRDVTLEAIDAKLTPPKKRLFFF